MAGNGKAGFSGDGRAATKASLDTPASIDFDAQGNMYIADQGNSVIRRVDTNGVITTYAGRFGTSDIGDGQARLDAFVGAPADLFVRPNGNVVFSDIFSSRVREILQSAPTFTVNPASLTFTAPVGSTVVDQSLGISGSIAGLSYAISTDSPSWLSVSASSGRMPESLRVSADPGSLAPGSYTGAVTIASKNASPSAVSIPISFTVTPAGQPSLSVSPNTVTFPFVQGATARSRPVSVSNAGGGSISFAAVASTTSGGAWLQAQARSSVRDRKMLASRCFGSRRPFESTVPGLSSMVCSASPRASVEIVSVYVPAESLRNRNWPSAPLTVELSNGAVAPCRKT